MPLVRFDMLKGRSPETIKAILQITHEVMVAAFEVPSVIVIKLSTNMSHMKWWLRIPGWAYHERIRWL